MCGGVFVGIVHQSGELLLGAAVAQLEVVEHGVLASCEALIRLDEGLGVGAERVGVVGDAAHGDVGHLRGLLGVASEGVDQGCGDARDALHVVVGAHTSGLERLLSVLLHELARLVELVVLATHFIDALADLLGVLLDALRWACSEELVDAADHLLVLGVGVERLLAHACDGRGECDCTCRSGCCAHLDRAGQPSHCLGAYGAEAIEALGQLLGLPARLLQGRRELLASVGLPQLLDLSLE